MKNYFLVFALVFSSLFSCSDSEVTTYYLIRHAEKDRSDTTNHNPDLTEKGLERAKKWAAYFNDISLDAVYSTKYNRTLQTAKSTAESKNLTIVNYDSRNMYTDDFKKATQGKTVLIVGHSNTTPVFANKILTEEKYQNMADDDNASLFIITLKKGNKISKIEKVN